MAGSKFVLFCVSTTVLVALGAYFVHIPLPTGITDRNKMHIFEVILRLTYFYPNKIFSLVGVPQLKLPWTRGTLTFFAYLLGPWSHSDPDLKLTDTTFDGVPVRMYVPKGPRDSDGAIVFIHGGGFVLMDVESYDGLTRSIARESNMLTVSIDYRLAPEHVFPAGVIDCERAVAHFLRTAGSWGVNPKKVVIMGDSAGGNLAAVTTQRLRERDDLPALKLQVLIYPVVQYLDFLTPSYQQYYREYQGTTLLDPESIARWLMMYMGLDARDARIAQVLKNNHTTIAADSSGVREWVSHEVLPESFKKESYVTPPEPYGNTEMHSLLAPWVLNPDFSPLLRDDLSSLPSALVVTCEYDILRDEGYWYAKRLRDAGVSVEHKHYQHGFHAMLNFHSELQLGRTAISDVVGFVKQNL